MSKTTPKKSLCISLMFGQVLWPMNSAMAAPVFDSGDLDLTGNNQYTVTANRAIAQWQSFVLGESEKIEFLNNSAEGKILLNLVNAGAGSKIAGELNAKNIQFILVDPSGINIAGSAKVDVSGLVLSAAGVSVPVQEGFKGNGNLLFDSSSNGKIIIDSDATLVPSNLENVVLIGKDIQNNANIEASGLVAMLATDKATLNFEGSNILGVSFNASALIDNANFVNNGTIIADRAFLASLAKNQAININKDITANQIVISGDKIQLASNITKNNENGLLKIGKLSSENASIDINLDAASELTIGSNSALSGFDDSQISVKANSVNVESETYTKATIKNNNKITLGGFTDITAVQSVSFTNNQNNGISTNSSALLTGTENSLTTRGVTFSGISNANLGGNSLTGSNATDSFVITSEGITANDIAVKNLNTTIDANGNAELSGADDNTWTITADNTLKEGGVGSVGGYVFTGLGQVAFAKDEAVLNGRGSDTFTFKDDGLLNDGLLDAASMNFETAHLKQVNNTHELITNADASLQSTNGGAIEKSLKTNGVIFTGVNTADLGGKLLTGSSATDSFVITSEGITANDIAVKNLNTKIKANGKASLLGAEDDTWLLTGVSGELKSQATDGYTFTGLTDADLVDKGLQGSVEYNRFTVTGENALTAAAIAFTGVNAVTGNANNGEVTTNADAGLTANKNALNTQGIAFTGIKTADLSSHKLTASAEQNTFNVTNENALTAAAIDFTGVNTVAGYDNNGEVNTSADAFLGEKENALNTQSITFTGIKTADLGGQTLIGSKSHDSFKIHTNGSGVNANGIEIVNLDRTINVNGAASLSGAQNNTWQLTNTTNTLEDSRDNGFVFVGVNDANLQGGVLSGSAVQNKYEIIDTQKLVAAAMTFTGVSKVNGHNKSGYLVANATTQLMDAENQLQTQGVILSGIGQAHLKGNVLKGSAAGSTLELISESRVDASGIKFFDFGSLDGNDNAGTLVSQLDTPQWTMTTANSGTVNNVEFTAFKTLKNSTGDLKLNAGKHIAKFDGVSVSFGGNTSLEFNEQKNVVINSENNINGSVAANDLNINTAGDVDLKTQINSITLNANNANLVQEGDLVIHSIDVKRTLNLNSADAGKNNLIAGSGNKVNVKATKASLGEHGKWDNIGVNAQPLSFEVVSELALVANTTVDPFFPSGQPLIFNLEGDRSESLLSSHTNALIQNDRVSNDANANLALFEALSPIYIDKNAVAGVHVKDSRLDVPSELEMEMLAALLSTENSTAAGKANKKKVLEKDDTDEI